LAVSPRHRHEGRPAQWTACLADLRPGDTLIIWKIDRLGRNLLDLVDIVATLETRGVGVKSLTNGVIDTTTAHGKLVFGMFALMAEYEAALMGSSTPHPRVCLPGEGPRSSGGTLGGPQAIGRERPMDDAMSGRRYGPGLCDLM
jgi:hypothetical protein